MEQSSFFINLPERKAAIGTGYCELPETGDLVNSVVVNIYEDCVGCQFLVCHMFRAILDENNQITARLFVQHDPEY